MWQFRAVTEADYAGICRLMPSQDELYLVYPRGIFPMTPEQLQQLATVRQALTVATLDDAVIGFANLYDFDDQHAFIGNVVIGRGHRGRGIGKSLVAYMLKLGFEDYGLKEMRISVFSGNTPALLLYAQLGFQPYGLEPRLNPQGQRVALIHMKLGLSQYSQAG